MKTTKQVRREAKHLFRLCLVNGMLDEGRVRQVVERVLLSKRRGFLALVNQFERLVKLEQAQHTAEIESATPLIPELQAQVRASLVQLYGPELHTSFAENPSLIGGMRIRVGSDVYDGSIRAGLATLEKRFQYSGPNGKHTES
ncbi:MAG TPA: F0F1 ATP synthase subunit delta [Pyrinomonadaceae bacterium]|nr:F0F1 ATP synthase subunit delta [Pyrinomonadaceae bacterium]